MYNECILDPSSHGRLSWPSLSQCPRAAEEGRRSEKLPSDAVDSTEQFPGHGVYVTLPSNEHLAVSSEVTILMPL